MIYEMIKYKENEKKNIILRENVNVYTEYTNFPFIIVSGSTASGKTFFANKLSEKCHNFEILTKYTTRKKRSNEIDNSDYYFVDDNDFKNELNNNIPFLYAYYYNSHYFLPKCAVDDAISNGKIPIIIFDVYLARLFKFAYKNSILIYCENQNVDTIYNILKERNEIDRKILVEEEMAFDKFYDIMINHEYDMKQVCSDIQHYLNFYEEEIINTIKNIIKI